MSVDEVLARQVAARLRRAAERLTKWRQVLAGWQLGSRTDGDAECAAVRDHREVTMLLRAENNAIVRLLIDKGLITELEWTEKLAEEMEHYEGTMQQRFPGMRATDDGISYELPLAAETMRRLNFKP